MPSKPVRKRNSNVNAAKALSFVVRWCVSCQYDAHISALAAYAQDPHATQHPNVGCLHGHGHLPGHHGHHCHYGSTPFPYQAPTHNDYQHWMRDLETGPPADLGDLATQIRQINQIQERMEQTVLQIQADQEMLRQRVRAQTLWGAYAPAQKRLAGAIQVDADAVEKRSR